MKPWWRNDLFMAVLAILSVALVYWFEEGDLNAMQRQVLLVLDLALVGFFLLDWGLAYRDAPDRRRFLWGNWWRLLGMVPLYVSGLAFLRLLRLIRIIYALDMIPPVHKFMLRLRAIGGDSHLGPLAGISGGITLAGATLVWLAERQHNPALASFGESLWWAIVTVTTVGYGDITPITNLGRGVAVLLMVTGIGTIGLLASQVSSALIQHKPGSDMETLVALHKKGILSDDELASAAQRIVK